MKLSYNDFKEWERAKREESAYIKKLDSGLNFVDLSIDKARIYFVDCPVYRFEISELSRDDTLKLFYRIKKNLRDNLNTKSQVAIIGFSEHKKWSKYGLVSSGKKGGRPKKVFTSNPLCETKPHIHTYITGGGSSALADKIVKNQQRYFKRKGQQVRVRKYSKKDSYVLPIGYVEAQSTNFSTFGDIDGFIEKHRTD